MKTTAAMTNPTIALDFFRSRWARSDTATLELEPAKGARSGSVGGEIVAGQPYGGGGGT